MLSFRGFVLTVGVLGLMAIPALAQQREKKSLGNLGISPIFLTEEPVQKELKFTDEQKSKAKDVVSEILQKRRDEVTALRGAPPDERSAKTRAINNAMAEEAVKALGMSEVQVKRYRQINLQSLKLAAFTRKEVEEDLKLTDDQKSQFREINAAFMTRAIEIRKNAAGNREEVLKHQAILNKETVEKHQAVLTDDQKATWKEIIGTPFEFTPQVFRRPPKS